MSKYLILLHHGNGSLDRVRPISRGILCILFLNLGNLIVGAAHLDQAVSKLRVAVKVLAVSNHGAAEDRRRNTLFANEVVAVGEPLDVRIHGGLELDHAYRVARSSLVRKRESKSMCVCVCIVHVLCMIRYIPSKRRAISVSRFRNSSVVVVLASWPIFSPAHWKARSNFLVKFMIAV